MADLTARLNQLSQSEDRLVRKTLESRIAGCEKAIKQLDAVALAAVKADPELARRHEILCSIKGCGDVTAGYRRCVPHMRRSCAPHIRMKLEHGPATPSL